MESIIIGEGIVELRFDSRKGIAELRNAQGEIVKTFETTQRKVDETFTKQIEKNISNIQKSTAVVGAQMSAQFLAQAWRMGSGFGEVAGKMVRSAIDLGDEIGRMAQKTGMGTTEIQRLQFAARYADVETSALQMGLKTLASSAYDASTKGGDAAKKFEALGIRFNDSTGKARPLNDILNDVADRFQRLPDGVQKSALAVDLFGRSGLQMIPLLNKGADGLRELGDMAQRSGLVMSADAVRGAEALNDRIKELNARIDGAKLSLSSSFVPALNETVAGLQAAASTGNTENINSTFTALMDGATNSIGPLRNLKEIIDGIRIFGSGKVLEEQLKGSGGAAGITKLLAQIATPPVMPSNELWQMMDAQTEEINKRKKAIEDAAAALNRAKESGAFGENFGPGKNLMMPYAAEALNAPDYSQYASGGADKVVDLLQTIEQVQFAADAASNDMLDAYRDANQARLAGDMKYVQMTQQQNANAILQGLGALAEGMGVMAQNNKALFIFQQGIAIIQMISDATAGWTKTFGQLGWAGFALGAGIFARIMAMVAQLRSMKAPEPPAMKIPGAAEGGLIKQPSIIAIAEKKPEVVIPLDKMGEMGGGGQTHIEVSVKDAPGLERFLAVRLVKRAKEENLPGWSFAHV